MLLFCCWQFGMDLEFTIRRKAEAFLFIFYLIWVLTYIHFSAKIRFLCWIMWNKHICFLVLLWTNWNGLYVNPRTFPWWRNSCHWRNFFFLCKTMFFFFWRPNFIIFHHLPSISVSRSGIWVCWATWNFMFSLILLFQNIWFVCFQSFDVLNFKSYGQTFCYLGC